MKITAILTNWSAHTRLSGLHLTGTICGDAEGRFNDGEVIITSPVKTIETVGTVKVARTLNSTYILA